MMLTIKGQGFSISTACEGIKIEHPVYAGTCTHTRNAPNTKEIKRKVAFRKDATELEIKVRFSDFVLLYAILL